MKVENKIFTAHCFYTSDVKEHMFKIQRIFFFSLNKMLKLLLVVREINRKTNWKSNMPNTLIWMYSWIYSTCQIFTAWAKCNPFKCWSDTLWQPELSDGNPDSKGHENVLLGLKMAAFHLSSYFPRANTSAYYYLSQACISISYFV